MLKVGKTLTLTYDEWHYLHEAKMIIVNRGGFDIVVEIDRYNEYKITIVNPYERVKCNTVRP